MPAIMPLKPCKAEAERYLKQWEEQADYASQELALNKLFLDLCPRNELLEDILLKVATLNDFYGTNIFKTYSVAKHIFEMRIDDRLQIGDLTLVEDLAKTEMPDKSIRNFYSFATKYCSHHRPETYAIYDSYVDEVLRCFRRRDKFSSFRNSDLKDYKAFVDIVRAFREFYGLNEYSLKDVDRYLWQLGKDCFPKKYN